LESIVVFTVITHGDFRDFIMVQIYGDLILTLIRTTHLEVDFGEVISMEVISIEDITVAFTVVRHLLVRTIVPGQQEQATILLWKGVQLLGCPVL
jgi:hypothetical protein